MKSLAFTIPGPPHGKQRHKHRVVVPKTGKPFSTTYDPPGNVDRKVEAQTAMILAANMGPAPHHRTHFGSGPLVLSFEAIFKCPKSHHRKIIPAPRRPYTKTPDVDNVLKWIMDAGSGILWDDDKQVSTLGLTQMWVGAQQENPRTRVWVSAYDGAQSVIDAMRLRMEFVALDADIFGG